MSEQGLTTMHPRVLNQLLANFRQNPPCGKHFLVKELEFGMSYDPSGFSEFGARPPVEVECFIPGSQQTFLFLTGGWPTLGDMLRHRNNLIGVYRLRVAAFWT